MYSMRALFSTAQLPLIPVDSSVHDHFDGLKASRLLEMYADCHVWCESVLPCSGHDATVRMTVPTLGPHFILAVTKSWYALRLVRKLHVVCEHQVFHSIQHIPVP